MVKTRGTVSRREREIYHRGKKNPPVVPGDKTKNKNYEQTLTLSDLSCTRLAQRLHN